MRLLIDTQVLIWHVEDDERLRIELSGLIATASNKTYVSIASLWEIAIKINLGKLKISGTLRDLTSDLEASSIELLAIKPEHILRLSTLPQHHRDPFDRMIIAQALDEGLPIITTDGQFSAYGVTLL